MEHVTGFIQSLGFAAAGRLQIDTAPIFGKIIKRTEEKLLSATCLAVQTHWRFGNKMCNY